MLHLETGELILHEVDFEFGGPIEISGVRNYFSQLERETVVGNKWHLNLEQSIKINSKTKEFVWHNCNGNILEMPYISTDDKSVVVASKIEYAHYADRFEITHYETRKVRVFKKVSEAYFRLEQVKKHRFRVDFRYDNNQKFLVTAKQKPKR